MKYSNKPPHHFNTKIVLAIASLIAIIFALNGLYSIYTNNKTDGHGSGRITVTSCSEEDKAWKVYLCKGDYFSSSGGMIERENVTVRVFGQAPKSGQKVEDVYPPAPGSAETTSYFVTGRERASVLYNIPSLFLVFIGIILPLFTIAVFVISRDKNHLRLNNRENS